MKTKGFFIGWRVFKGKERIGLQNFWGVEFSRFNFLLLFKVDVYSPEEFEEGYQIFRVKEMVYFNVV